MEKTTYDESNGLWYELRGDYYIPCLTLQPQEERPIGIWGQQHLRYIKQERKALYTELLTSGKLNTYLADINEQAENMFLELLKHLAAREGVTEQLKAQDQMLWVQRMNSIRDRVMETVNHDLIYA
ncbi:MAG: TnpV protein [Oscillospiraceae bacterium]|nr:TnpV protein [Oscillospiraceae bacterium]MBQ6756112.1 TnpV protein [Oscillospiraceae bacterium]